jgi:membrane dipeptidase
MAETTQELAAAAARLGISREAMELYAGSDVVDLHIDSFIWTRVFGYDLTKRHGRGLLGARFYSQVDLPRIREARITGGLWSITTMPFRSAARRAEVFAKNLARLKAIFESASSEVALVRDLDGYRAAKASGRHAAFVGIQGGNALDRDPNALKLLDDGTVLRVTLVHLSKSSLGMTSAPTGGDAGAGLTRAGREYVEALDARRIFVDLAHVSRRGFFDAVEVHDRSLPLIVTHTGIRAVHDHWRNLDDEQIRAVADTGGVVGVMYQSPFLGDSWLGGRAETIVRHLEHVVQVGGEEAAALGSDWDGMISPPRDMATCLELPRLVQLMLDRGWKPERVTRVLGANFLRSLARLRGERAVAATRVG